MSEREKEHERREENKPNLDMMEMLDEAMKLLRAALLKERQKGTDWEAVRLYQGTDDPSHKTEATKAALLSNWPDFFLFWAGSRQDDETLSKEQLAALFIHHTFNRWRRKNRRDKQIAHEIDRATVHGEDGELLPFDPKDPRDKQDFMENLYEVMALIIEEWTRDRDRTGDRDRMILKLKYFDDLDPQSIIVKIREALPGVPISGPTISRIVAQFEDYLRRRLKEE